MKIRVAHLKKLTNMLPAPKVVGYFQIEDTIRALIRFRPADEVPLVSYGNAIQKEEAGQPTLWLLGEASHVG